jgi:ATP-dependent exoDNAse (exonuclease V) beta subunit
MIRTERNGNRFYSGGIIPEGQQYPSVTTILKATPKSEALIAWSAKVEREMVLEEAAHLYSLARRNKREITPSTFLLRLVKRLGVEKAHSKELRKAGQIGDQIHKLCEWSLRAELLEQVGPSPLIRDEAKWAYDQFLRWKQSVALKPVLVEAFVACNCHRIAGTVDLVAEVNGELSVCDWKSGKYVYPESWLQAAAYRHCIERMGLGQASKSIVLRLPKIIGDPEFEAFEVPEPAEKLFEEFLNVKRVWEWFTNYKR